MMYSWSATTPYMGVRFLVEVAVIHPNDHGILVNHCTLRTLRCFAASLLKTNIHLINHATKNDYQQVCGLHWHENNHRSGTSAFSTASTKVSWKAWGFCMGANVPTSESILGNISSQTWSNKRTNSLRNSFSYIKTTSFSKSSWPNSLSH